ncbi:SDR family NAD(P)-dependent oxidoreductase [Paeniglutamicibacter sp. NPDC012692]|uniref:SDR family NAD(P)-dependent oxidoreductase n=1 Tax=Paeniglutamicibacter sp. NPDC012692 TaxID=3364388 RepID=UPI00369AB979
MSIPAYDFTHKTGLITGATGGIGRDVARLLFDAGANLVLLDLDPGSLNALAVELGDDARVAALAGDASSPEIIDGALALTTARFGALDFVVPAAGIYPESPVTETSDELWRKVMDINLDGVFRLLRAATPVMADGGAIVNFASLAGHRGSKNHAHYAASKAGVIALTRSLAHELGHRGIRVNAVSPGTISTPMVEALVAERGESMLSGTPLNRFGNSMEVAQVAAFLCSDGASFINGETIHVNGGLFMAG